MPRYTVFLLPIYALGVDDIEANSPEEAIIAARDLVEDDLPKINVRGYRGEWNEEHQGFLVGTKDKEDLDFYHTNGALDNTWWRGTADTIGIEE